MQRAARGWRTALALATVVLGATAAPIAATGQTAVAVMEIQGTAVIARLHDGSVLGPEDLLGAVLEATDEQGRLLTVRLDAFRVDPRDKERAVILYRVSMHTDSGEWRELCAPDPDGNRWALFLAGAWTRTGEHRADPQAFIIACSSGAIGKCIRLGYKPWKRMLDGISLWDYHQACVRMLRADYCGDGASFTRNGMLIDLYDGLGIQHDEAGPGMRFEAGWGSDGATCIARARIPEKVTLAGLAQRCPLRLAGRVGRVCTEDRALRLPATLLVNKS